MRTLAILCFSFSAAIFASVYLFPFAWIPAVALSLLLPGLCLCFLRRRWLRPLMLAALGAAVGFGWFYLHELRTVVPAHLLDASTRTVEARVLDYPQTYDSYCRVVVRVESDELPRLDAILYDSSFSTLEAVPGDRIRFEARFSPADRRFGEAYDAYTARDIYLKLNNASEVFLLEKGGKSACLPARIRHALLTRIESLFPEDVGAFMKSLLLGDKSDLYENERLYLAISRAGNMHALAVSGLHIAFLIGMLHLLLGRNALSAWLCIILSWAFVLITGASPSAVRAGVMQSLLLAAPVLRRENDPPTTLAFALGLILLQNPRAAVSVSLQLSFAAMAGILCYARPLYSWMTGRIPRGFWKKALSGPAAAAASSLAVLPFTVPLMVLHFGYISLVSPLSSVLCYLAISLCFCGGWLACLLSVISAPAGALAAWQVSWIARYIAWISEMLSALPYAVLYTELFWCVPWLIGTYLLFIGYRFLPLKRREKLLFPAALSLLSMMLLLNLTRLHYEREDGYFSVLDVGQGQCLCAFSGSRTVVVDCGNLMSQDQAGELAGRFLISRGRDRIDALILTHPDADHTNGVSLLMEMLPVDRVIVPAGVLEDKSRLSAIRASAEEKGSEWIPLGRDACLHLDPLTIELFAPLSSGASNDAGLFAELHYGSYDVLVTGDASAEREKAFLLHALPAEQELLVVGHHGSRYASCEELLRGIGADTAVISVGYNTFGHPEEETLERLSACGYNVYRTDADGTLIFRIEDGHGEKERER